MQERALSPEQRERFIHNGFVVLRNVISQPVLDEALDVVIETIPEDMTDFEALSPVLTTAITGTILQTWLRSTS